VRRARPFGWPLWVSLAVHGLVALLLLRGTPHLDRARGPQTVELEVTTSPPAEAPRPEVPEAREKDGTRRERKPPRPRVVLAPPAPSGGDRGGGDAAPPSVSWLSMRGRGTVDLNAPGEGAGPARDPLGLPYNPLPEVVHRPASPRAQPGVHTTASGLEVRIEPDGTLMFRDPGAVRNVRPTVFPSGLVGVSGTFDINDALERAAGNDPYAAEKRKIAEETFEDRLCLAQAAARQRKQEGLFRLSQQLQRLTSTPGLSDARRRELVFDLWDDCVEETADGEPDLGAAARATIIAFIRRTFPPESPRAYTAGELASLNARRSSRRAFAPYGH
jgi:hypothetical protein